jgi:hypothetical protein
MAAVGPRVEGDCDGLARGVYHYDPLGHRLEPVPAVPAAVGELLGWGWPTAWC